MTARSALLLIAAALVGTGFLPAADAPQPDHASVIEREAGSITAAKAWVADQETRAVRAVKPLSPSLPAVATAAAPSRPGSAPGGPALAGGQEGDEEPEPIPPTPTPEPTPAESEDLVTISGPDKAATGGYFILSVKMPAASADVLTEFLPAVPPDCPPPIELLSKTPGESLYLYQQCPKGVYRFVASAQVSVDKAEGFDPHDHDEWTVTVGGPAPQPPGPDPEPEPEPVDPDDKPPFPADGLHVLMVFETATQNQLPAGQRSILFARSVREFLNGKTAKGPEGSPAYRIWDADTDVSGAAKVWQDAMAVPRQSLPWLIVNNGRAWYSGPLPADPAAFQELVNKYAE